ncbi:unnamed protein product [Dicrocoelium dendriticum]|nr:unnamed protein product [Dicrocoelium dendriticum]
MNLNKVVVIWILFQRISAQLRLCTTFTATQSSSKISPEVTSISRSLQKDISQENEPQNQQLTS